MPSAITDKSKVALPMAAAAAAVVALVSAGFAVGAWMTSVNSQLGVLVVQLSGMQRSLESFAAIAEEVREHRYRIETLERAEQQRGRTP